MRGPFFCRAAIARATAQPAHPGPFVASRRVTSNLFQLNNAMALYSSSVVVDNLCRAGRHRRTSLPGTVDHHNNRIFVGANRPRFDGIDNYKGAFMAGHAI